MVEWSRGWIEVLSTVMRALLRLVEVKKKLSEKVKLLSLSAVQPSPMIMRYGS